MVKASLDEKKMTGNDRTPAWDGLTTGGDSLRNQMNAINDHKVCRLKLNVLFHTSYISTGSSYWPYLHCGSSLDRRSCFAIKSDSCDLATVMLPFQDIFLALHNHPCWNTRIHSNNEICSTGL